MRKYLLILLSTFIACTQFGCNGDGGDSSPQTTQSPTSLSHSDTGFRGVGSIEKVIYNYNGNQLESNFVRYGDQDRYHLDISIQRSGTAQDSDIYLDICKTPTCENINELSGPIQLENDMQELYLVNNSGVSLYLQEVTLIDLNSFQWDKITNTSRLLEEFKNQTNFFLEIQPLLNIGKVDEDSDLYIKAESFKGLWETQKRFIWDSFNSIEIKPKCLYKIFIKKTWGETKPVLLKVVAMNFRRSMSLNNTIHGHYSFVKLNPPKAS